MRNIVIFFNYVPGGFESTSCTNPGFVGFSGLGGGLLSVGDCMAVSKKKELLNYFSYFIMVHFFCKLTNWFICRLFIRYRYLR